MSSLFSTNTAAESSNTSAPGVALEHEFPSGKLWAVARRESWRKEIYRPLYHIHKWWATRLGSVFRALLLGALQPPGTDIWKSFYQAHDLREKVILDPFMGSGTTIGEAVKLGSRAIGCDINPISTFLVQQALTPVPTNDLLLAFSELERSTAPDLLRFYKTRDPESNEVIDVLYFFWVKLVKTPNGERIPMFSSYVFAQNAYPDRKPIARIVCPACGKVNAGRFNATELVCSRCAHSFNPQAGPAKGQFITDSKGARHRIKDLVDSGNAPPEHRMYALLAVRKDGERIYLEPAADDFALYETARKTLEVEDLPIPQFDLRPGHNTDQARGYGYLRWRDFFNDRQLLCLGRLLKAISNIEHEDLRDQMLCLFSSALEFNNLFCSFKGEGTGAVRHMFSHHILKPERVPLENNLWGTPFNSGSFSTLFKSRLLPAKAYLEKPFELAVESDLFDAQSSTKVVCSKSIETHVVDNWNDFSTDKSATLILNGDSSSLPIPSEQVDAVVTDPPYFDFVHYSELSDFFYAWLAPTMRTRRTYFSGSDSSHHGEVQSADPILFSQALGRVFAECYRVLKSSGVLIFTFHHSRPEGWLSVFQAIQSAGLRVSATHVVHAELSLAQPKKLAKEPITLDAIIVCRKHIDPVLHQLEGTRSSKKEQMELEELSKGDRFVIAAAEILQRAGSDALTAPEVSDLLSKAYRGCQGPTLASGTGVVPLS